MLGETGANIIDIDWMVDYASAVAHIGEKVTVNGNIDPVGVFLQGSANDVANAVMRCHAAGNARSMISAGCELPVGTPEANLAAHYEMAGRLKSTA
ncbi:MAG: hypothetical protein GXY52_04190 [Chloroflexi bacterium]|nr:hypothetical protein [Chloroflexota bacterium]